jgi:hypothetical protein
MAFQSRLRPRVHEGARFTRSQLKGQFLIDRDGIIRWANIACSTEGLAGVGKFPSVDEAARTMPGG